MLTSYDLYYVTTHKHEDCKTMIPMFHVRYNNDVFHINSCMIMIK